MHLKGTHATAARDAVKKEALRRAGIGYVEVVAGDEARSMSGGHASTAIRPSCGG
jgi:hypothetical protein